MCEVQQYRCLHSVCITDKGIANIIKYAYIVKKRNKMYNIFKYKCSITMVYICTAGLRSLK